MSGRSTLADVPEGNMVRVINIVGGWGIRQRLSQLGIYPGDIIRVVRSGAFRGPIYIDVNGNGIAIGRGVASHIEVEEV